MERFAAYLAREGIGWPLLETGKLSLRRNTFEDMSKAVRDGPKVMMLATQYGMASE